MNPNTTERIGVVDTQALFEHNGWKFEENRTTDVGVDATVEVGDRKRGLVGRLFGVQIKSGKSYVNARNDGVIYVDRDTVDYWMGHSLPIVAVVRRPDGVMLWAPITSAFVRPTPTRYRVSLPSSRVLNAAALDEIASLAGWQLEDPLEGATDAERGLVRLNFAKGFMLGVVGSARNVFRQDVRVQDAGLQQARLMHLVDFSLSNTALDKGLAVRFSGIPVPVFENDTIAVIYRVRGVDEALLFAQNRSQYGNAYIAKAKLRDVGDPIIMAGIVLSVILGGLAWGLMEALAMPNVVRMLGTALVFLSVCYPVVQFTGRAIAPERDAFEAVREHLEEVSDH